MNDSEFVNSVFCEFSNVNSTEISSHHKYQRFLFLSFFFTIIIIMAQRYFKTLDRSSSVVSFSFSDELEDNSSLPRNSDRKLPSFDLREVRVLNESSSVARSSEAVISIFSRSVLSSVSSSSSSRSIFLRSADPSVRFASVSDLGSLMSSHRSSESESSISLFVGDESSSVRSPFGSPASRGPSGAAFRASASSVLGGSSAARASRAPDDPVLVAPSMWVRLISDS